MKKRQLPEPGPSFSQIPPFNQSAAENEIAEDLIERYLGRVFGPLQGEISNDVLAERRLEMKAHIEELADSYTGDQQRAIAVQSALKQIGSPASVTRAWRREQTAGRIPVAHLVSVTSLVFFVAAACAWPILGTSHPEAWPILLWLPFAGGLMTGLSTLRRPVLQTARIQLALSAPATALNFAVFIWPRMMHDAQAAGAQNISFLSAFFSLARLFPHTVIFLVVAFGIWWIGTACLGALIGARLHRRFLHRRLLAK